MTESLTQKEFARRINRSPRLVRKLTEQDVLPRNPDGTYPWPEAHEAWVKYKEYERDRRFGSERGAGSELDAQRTRKLAAEAEKAELDLAERRKELLHIRDVERLVRLPLEHVDAALRNAPARYASDLAQAAGVPIAVAQRQLEQVIERIREDLRRTTAGNGDDAAA